MQIICMRYLPSDCGTFLGYVDFQLPEKGLEILNCTLHRKDEKRWINLPSRSYIHKNEEKFRPVLKFIEQKEFHEFCEKSKIALDLKLQEENVCVER